MFQNTNGTIFRGSAPDHRITQEIKFLHKKKQNLNSQLYYIHLKCADNCNSIWQHIEDSIEVDKFKRSVADPLRMVPFVIRNMSG